MVKGILVSALALVAAMPSSSNYTLQAYDVVQGGGSGSSTNYGLRSAVGGPGNTLSSTNYRLPAGVTASMTAPVPPAPTLSNPNSSYSALHLTLSVSGFASDTEYLIAISDDNFVTAKYVQPDQTISASLTLSNYQTYAAWGGANGFDILGLAANTTYKVKVAALQGGATGSGFGPEASAATIAPSVTFAVSTSLTSAPPFGISLTSLPVGAIVPGNATITADITTNAGHGGVLLIKDANAGLASTARSYTIASASADLASAASGYGAQIHSTSQDSGGPLVAVSPFDSSGDAVGALTTVYQPLATFASAVDGGSVTLGLKAKAGITTPSSSDYSDVLTLSISLLF